MSRPTKPPFGAFRYRKSVVAVAALALVGGMSLPSTPVFAADMPAVTAPTPKLGKPVKTHHAGQAATTGGAKSSVSAPGASPSTLQAGTSTVDTPAAKTSHDLTTKTTRAGVAATVDGAWQKVAETGLQVAAARSKAAGAVGRVKVTVQSQHAQAGSSGLVVQIKRADGSASAAPVAVKIPQAVLRGQFGADYASRLRWVQSPATPASTSTSTSTTPTPTTPVAQAVEMSTNSVVLSPMVTNATVTLTAAAAPVASNGTGNFAATPLSSASSWDVSPQTGEFSWQYAMRTPPAAAGPSPSLALNYDSQSVDGESGSTNNQPSAVGDGWNLSGGGFIERNYVSCSLDDTPVTTSGDLCWKSDNATISVAGHSGLLVKDKTSGAWKLQSDDGSKFEHLVGASAGCGAANGTYDDDCWRMTTRDGTKYYFGMNELPGWASGKAATNSAWTVPVFGNDSGEPCHASTFAASSCVQAWRWNLDYVVDVHGNAEALYYNAETNKYSRGGSTVVTYTRGGQLAHIDYGLTSSTVYGTNAADDKVVFGYDAYGRCSDAAHTNCTSEAITSAATAPAHPTYYPDVPFDQLCTGTTCTEASPSFFTDGMLDTVTTQALVSGAYQTVDTWTLSHSFPAPGDGTNAALWLTQVVHKGTAGQTAISEPATKFSGVTMQNRVWVKNGLAPLDKWRISSITTSLGAVISVNYSAQQCTATNAPTIEASPWSNANWCFPQWWTPGVIGAQTPQEDLFHKYVVTSVIANPKTGGGLDQAQETDYVYGTPRWRYDNSPLTPTKQRTWNQYAGVDTLETRVGDHSAPAAQQVTDDTFYQGMNGDRAGTSGGTKTVNVTGTSIPDSLWFAGQTYEEKTLLGVGGATLSDTINTPWASSVTSDDGTNTARMTDVQDTVTTEPVSTGGNRTSETKTTFDSAYGDPLTVSTIHSDAPDTCATTSYTTPNTSAWIVGLPKEVQTVAVDCANLASAQFPKDLLGDTRTYYDSSALGIVGAKGDVTSTQEVDSYTGTTANWVTASTSTYDALGRVLVAKDVLGHTTTNAYTPADSAGPLTSESVTNTLGWKTTTAFNPAWGAETSYTDQNSHLTTATYDGLGRRTQVWLPQHTQAANPSSPSMSYVYTLSQTAANAIATTTLTSGGNDLSYQLFDGLGQPIQTQGVASGGAIVASTGYDTAGRVNWQDNTYWTTSVTPSAVLVVPNSETTIPSQIRTTFDGAGRPTAAATWSNGTERFETDTAYQGADRVDTTPPTGGTASSVFSDSAGDKTKLVQYPGHTVTGTGQTTTYTYDAAARMTGMTDPAGNTWTWGFDVLGHQTTANDPDTGATTSRYDDAGNLLSTTDARGQQLSYTYDALNRRTAEYAGTSTGSLLDSWVYDTVAKGDLTSSSSYTGSTPGTPGLAYTSTIGGYDAADQPTSTTVSIPTGAPAFGGTTYTVGLTRGADESVTAQADPAMGGLAAETVHTTYNAQGQSSGTSATGLSVTISHTAIRQISQIERDVPAGFLQPVEYLAYSGYGYDQATGALMTIADNANFNGAGHWVAQRIYTRDNVGDITSSTTTADTPATFTQTDCYSYDGYGELTQVFTPGSGSTCQTTPSTSALGGPAPVWDTYTYDAKTGNRATETVHATTGTGTDHTATYAYPTSGTSQPHTVTTVAGAGAPGAGSYGYDQAGNTTTAPGQTLTYDEQGRLATDTTSGGTQRNIYDASGNLLLQTNPGQGASLFLGDTVLHQTGTDPISAVRTYTAAGTPVAERTGTTGSSTVPLTWLFTDVDGNVDVQTDSTSGTTTDSFRDPFGNPTSTGTGIWADGNGFLNHPATTSTGLVSLGARFYNPAIGRFISVDPALEAGDPQQVNGYGYAANNPITNTDASGLCANYATGILTMNANCAGGHGSNKADADTVNQQHRANQALAWRANTWGVSLSHHISTGHAPAAQSGWDKPTPHAGRGYGLKATANWDPGTPSSPQAWATVGLVGIGIIALVPGLDVADGVLLPADLAVLSGETTATGAVESSAAVVIDAATESSAATEDAAGFVYRRTDLYGGKPYIGQAKSAARYAARQQEHARDYPGADFDFEELGRAQPGTELDRLEEYWIRQEGGPTNLSNPDGGLANWRHQMSDIRYQNAGGDPW